MLEHLEPKLVWHYFEQFCAIPHPSGHEKKAAQFIIDCATQLGLTTILDPAGNVLVRKQATDPYKKKVVILQSHLDMVPQKNATTVHDFTKDPITLQIIDGWLKARGTTLGADNGIGVAITLAILASSNINHGPIEALFTIDEERGMTGAFNCPDNLLTGRILINLDTENELELCIGCAGGTDILATIPFTRLPTSEHSASLQLTLNGLRGGHSGIEINCGRANALKLLSSILTTLFEKYSIQLSSISGGTARNAIPREAFATIVFPTEEETNILECIKNYAESIAFNFKNTDPSITLVASACPNPSTTISPKAAENLLTAISFCPNGVIAMSPTMNDAVQTSNNVAIVTTDTQSFHIDCMLRSSLESDLLSLKDQITTLFTNNNATISYGSIYPGWQPVNISPIKEIMKSAYLAVHKKLPEIVAVHAGLECGILGSKFPEIDMISCGPTIQFAHSPDEQMLIPSVERFWKSITLTLEMID